MKAYILEKVGVKFLEVCTLVQCLPFLEAQCQVFSNLCCLLQTTSVSKTVICLILNDNTLLFW